MIPMKKLLAACVALALSLTACSPATSASQPSERLTVVASFYPLQFVAERVGGDRVQVSNLTPPGSDPHDLELAPSQVASLSKAALVFYQKGLQSAVDTAIESQQPAQVLEATAVVPLHGEAEAGHDAEASASPGAHDHDHEGADPHSWLDPATMIAYSKAFAARMSQLDPAGTAGYQQRSDALVADLTALDATYTKGLTQCERRTIVVSHEAFGYLAERYNLEQVAIAGLSPDVEPTPARVAEVQRVAKEQGVTTVFYETLTSPAVAQAIAGDLGLKTDVLDPIEGINDSSRGKDYLEVMGTNLTALRTANGCQ